MARSFRVLAVAAASLVVLAAATVAFIARRPEIPPATSPDRAGLDSELVERGATLAVLGACETCHTVPGGAPFAGGRAIQTPFGTIHSTNLTPHPGTGIGTWSEAAFVRSMREGIDREGNLLYPAFPYTHFARTSDADLAALYAYLMVLDPVEATAPANALRFPASVRPFMAVWNLIYHDPAPFEPDPERSETWNRGAYLVEGLGHCGACHSARDALGGIAEDGRYAGGAAEGWHAPALGPGSPAPIPWSDLAIVNYLLDGWDMDHGVVAGPMTPVVDHLYEISEDDAFAMAEYLLSLMPEPADGARDAAIAFAEARAFGGGVRDHLADLQGPAARGAETYEEICANCHNAASETVPLALTSTVNMPDPANVIHIVVDGIVPPEGSPTKSMRAFGTMLSDDDLADLLVFLREHFTERPPWENLEDRIAEARAGGK